MAALVHLHLSLCAKRFATKLTQMRQLTRVHRLVGLQRAGTVVALVAGAALVDGLLAAARSFVIRQRHLRVKFAATALAHKSVLLGRQALVLVSRVRVQTVGICKHLVADFAVQLVQMGAQLMRLGVGRRGKVKTTAVALVDQTSVRSMIQFVLLHGGQIAVGFLADAARVSTVIDFSDVMNLVKMFVKGFSGCVFLWAIFAFVYDFLYRDLVLFRIFRIYSIQTFLFNYFTFI